MKKIIKLMLKNALPFVINLAFIIIFGQFFGAENMLLSVAIAVGLTMLPLCDLKIKPLPAALIILVLYGGSALAGQSVFLSPYLAFLINFLFVLLILFLIKEPEVMKPSISFLLAFVFCQSTPVSWDAFPMRLLCALIGSLCVILTCFLFWWRKGYHKGGRTLKEQIKLCNQNHRYIFRLSFGIALAMFLGMILHLKKPLWISIVVMSLTQLDWSETKMRMKYRFVGTLLGIIIFFLLFQLLLPHEYAMYFIILLGYLGSFTTEYKYKQAINAVSALNASLVLLDTKEAMIDRLFLLFLGMILVLILYFIAELLKKCKEYIIKKREEKLLVETEE